MTITDWEFNGNFALDTGTKIEGNGSLKIWAGSGPTTWVSRKNFSATQLQVVLYLKASMGASPFDVRVLHGSYADLVLVNGSIDWTRFRVTFWYDSTTNTKFARIETWDPSTNSWVRQGNDVNCGTGTPAPNTIGFNIYNGTAWIDDVYVYTV